MYDVIVSGAGPAGSHSAYRCARLGLRTLLVERSSLPRKKCCAGGVLNRALLYLDSPPESVVERHLNSFSITLGEESFRFPLVKEIGITVRREAFDAHLVRRAEAAGVEIMESAMVRNVREEDDVITIRVNDQLISSRYMIVAEGVNSRSAKALFGPADGKRAVGMAMECELEGDPGDCIDIHLIAPHPFWIRGFPTNGAVLPLRRSAMVSLVSTGGAKGVADGMERMLNSLNDRYGVLRREETCAHPVPMVARRRVCGRRALLVGDAAGFVSPLSGEGITYALRSGELAGKAVLAAMEGKPLSIYQHLCDSEIIFHQRAAALCSPWSHWLIGVVDTKRLLMNLGDRERLLEAMALAARGEGDWRLVLRKVIPAFPSLFFSSL